MRPTLKPTKAIGPATLLTHIITKYGDNSIKFFTTVTC